MRETQKKGDIGVAKAICTFTEKGWDVSLPITESAKYDLIVDSDGSLYRVQVRYSTKREVGLRRIHSNSSGYVVKKNNNNDYDWLYVYMSDGKEYLIRECLAGRNCVYPQEKDMLRKI